MPSTSSHPAHYLDVAVNDNAAHALLADVVTAVNAVGATTKLNTSDSGAATFVAESATQWGCISNS